MELYDQNITELGLSQNITSVRDAEIIHQRMIKLRTDTFMNTGAQVMPHYRGEQFFGWDITPGIYRTEKVQGDVSKAAQLEKTAMQEFEKAVHEKFGKNALRTLFHNETHGRDWDLLLQAQHAGVKTRLLDWTPEVLSALYFCTEKSDYPDIEKADGQLWVYEIPTEFIRAHSDYPVRDTYYEQDPSQLKDGCMINSSIYLDELKDRVFESRMYKQKGRFYISGVDDCHIPLNRQKAIIPYLFRFKVQAADKPIIRKELEERGITRDYFYVKEDAEHTALIEKINQAAYG